MKTLHRIAISAAALVLVFALPAVGHAAASAPTFTAVTMNGDIAGGAILSFEENRVYSGSQVTLTNSGAGIVISAASTFSFTIQPSTGGSLTLGTFPTLFDPDATHAGLALRKLDSICATDADGSITIEQITRSGSGITAFAASYYTDCGYRISGEIRFNSAIGYEAFTQDVSSFDYGGVAIGATSPPQTVTFSSLGSEPVSFGAVNLGVPDFAVSADTCSDRSIPGGSSCHISVNLRPTVLGQHYGEMSIADSATVGRRVIELNGEGQVTAAGTYHWLSQTRILDTRYGLGAPRQPVGPGGSVQLEVTGHGGVPVTNVSAVVLNVTETSATRGGFITVYPAGTTRPTASNLNYTSGQTLANMVTVAVNTSDEVAIYNSGSAQIIADVIGYYSATNASPTGGEFFAVSPSRIMDTRTDRDSHALAPGASVDVVAIIDNSTLGTPIDGSDVSALAVNVTAVDATGSGYLTAWGAADAAPGTSTLNFVKGVNTPNMSIVPVLACGESCASPGEVGSIFTVQNNSPTATVQVLVDLVGVFDDGTTGDGMRFHAVTPERIADSRHAQGMPNALTSGETDTIAVPGDIADGRTGAVALNVTAVAPSASTFLTLWSAGSARPVGSTLNPKAGQTVANAAIAAFTTAQPAKFDVYNATGTTGFLADVAGYYEYDPPA